MREDGASRLTVRGERATLRAVHASAIKPVGRVSKTPWQRFARLQRTAAKLAKGRGQPKGVFRFASHEACDAWTASLNRNGK